MKKQINFSNPFDFDKAIEELEKKLYLEKEFAKPIEERGVFKK